MKLFNSVGPNPQVVRMFAAELGIELALQEVDLMAGENRQAEYSAKNPASQLPCLELDDGTHIAEVTAICEYLDDINSGASLLGATPEERANSRMWTRRVDLNICEPLANGFRFAEGLPLFKERITVLPEAAEGLKRIAQEKLTWLDGLIDGRDFIGGDKIGLADILLYCFLAFGTTVRQPLNTENTNIAAWFDRMNTRPSATA